MSLADELSGAFGGGGGGGGGGRKRRAASRRQQQYSSDEDEDVAHSLAPANHATSIAGEIEAAQQQQHAAVHTQDGSGIAHQSSLEHEQPGQDISFDSPTPPPGSAEAEFLLHTSKACSQLLDVVASTNTFLQHLRTSTDISAHHPLTTSGSNPTAFPTSATVSNFNLARSAGATADDTARLEAYAASLLRTMRDQAKQREQYVRDLREVDRHMARAETTDPEFLAKLGEADERLDFEADEADAEADAADGDRSGAQDDDRPQTQTWADAQRRRRQGSTGSAETERPEPTSVAPRFRPEVITSEVTDTLNGLLHRSPNDIDVEAGKDGSSGHGHDLDDEDHEDEYDGRDTTLGSSRADRSYDHDDEEGDELGPGWDDPARAQRGSAPAGALADISIASTNAGGGSSSGAPTPTTLPSLRTTSTMLMHHFSSVHETAQVAGAILASHDRRLRTLRHLLEGWKEEIVAARRSRAWIAKWEGREPERDDLYLDEDEENDGKLDEVLANTLATVAAGAGGAGSKYTAGSGITPGAYAQEQMSRFQRLLAEAEERAQALLTPLPLPSVGAAAA